MRQRPQTNRFTPPPLRCTAQVLQLIESVTTHEQNSQECNALRGTVNRDVSQVNSSPNIVRSPKKLSAAVETVVATKPAVSVATVALFTVVWGKSNTRKHKTWEGDGRLEVNATSWRLTNDVGAVLGSTRAAVETQLVPGTRIRVGNKEVEIVEELKEVGHLEPKNSTENEPTPMKKPCTHRFFHKGSGNKPLLFPRPANEHQWRHNARKSLVRDVVLDSILNRSLRPHQKDGVVFLYECVMGFKNPNYCGAILADEMGLGKTLQSIALIWTLLKQGPYGEAVCRRVLVVTPSSLCANWGKEFSKWLGRERIQTYVVDKTHRTSHFANHPLIPIMIISYEQFVRNFDSIEAFNFEMIVCDEGHRLKNSSVKAAQLVSRLRCKRRILLTGTPVQNDLQEYFALIDLVNPGILGTYSQFRKNYELPIVDAQEPNCVEEAKSLAQEKSADLNRLISKFILRRTHDVMENYLPCKVDLIVCCSLSHLQRDLYGTVITQWFGSEVKNPFATIATLRKLCNHPALIEEMCKEPYDLTKLSGKVSIIDSLLKNIVIEKNENVVLVSYSTKFLDILEKLCAQRRLKFLRLDGSTPVAQRKALVDSFNLHSAKIFLVSARAGGTGLNLTGASRLVLTDGDWNPSNDLQALARIWRDGQKKNVTIYRLICTGTIEEKIFQRQLSKLSLSDSVDDPENLKSVLKFSEEELKDLFTPNFTTGSLTHDVLQCSCQRDPERAAGQTMEVKVLHEQEASGVNQLKEWQHFKPPFDPHFLRDIGLIGDHTATFIFQKITNQSNSV